MSFLQLLNKPEKKKSLGVCVPEAYRKKHLKQVIPETVSESNAFRIMGVFAVHDSVMLQGEMVKGCLKAGQQVDFHGKQIKIKDISIDRKPVEQIDEGMQGAIFLNTKKFPMLRAGELIEF